MHPFHDLDLAHQKDPWLHDLHRSRSWFSECYLYETAHLARLLHLLNQFQAVVDGSSFHDLPGTDLSGQTALWYI